MSTFTRIRCTNAVLVLETIPNFWARELQSMSRVEMFSRSLTFQGDSGRRLSLVVGRICIEVDLVYRKTINLTIPWPSE